MDFSKKFIRVLALVLTVLMILPTVPSFAATFKDVKSSHWAYSYIEEMAKEGYIKGDPDGNFRPDLPNGSLSFLEVLTFVSRILNVTSSEKQAMKTTYQTAMTKNGVPDWAQEAVMMCLYKGVITTQELEYAASMDMIKTGTTKRVGRLATSIYLAKAMGLEDEANAKSFVSLTYKDLLKIDTKYHKLIYVLIEAGVLSANGTGDGYFEPSGFVSRAQMAKMLSTAVDYLEKNPQTQTPTTPTTPVTDKETITGEIISITNLGTNTFVTVKSKTEAAYLVDSNTIIKFDGKTATVNDLFKGQIIEIVIKKGTSTAISIEIEDVEQKISGTIKSLTPSSNRLEVEYLENKVNKTVTLNVDKNSDITLNGEEADLYDLTIGDEVKLIMKNYLVIEMDATSKSGEVEGLIVELVTEGDRNPKYYVTIENSNKVKTEYEFHEDASIYRDGRRAEFKDLRIGDEAIIELEYGLVVEIDAEMIEKDVEGFIVAISTRLNTGTEITIKNRETNKEETYTLARNAVIKVDNDDDTTIFNVNVGYFVETVVGGNEIIELYADSVGAESIVRGKVLSTSTRRNEIVLSVMTTDLSDYEFGDEITILVTSNTIISDGIDDNLTLDDINRNHTLYIFGYYDGVDFRATEINIR